MIKLYVCYAVKGNDDPVRHRIQNYTNKNGGIRFIETPVKRIYANTKRWRVTYVSVKHENLIQLHTRKSPFQVSLFHQEEYGRRNKNSENGSNTYHDLTLPEEPSIETLHGVLISLGQKQYAKEDSIQNVQYFSHDTHFVQLQLQGKLRDRAHCHPSKTLI
jgi:hypothetical protein